MSRRALQRYARAAIAAAAEAGALLAKHAGKPKTIRTKRSPIDLVTEIDKASERLIRTRLARVAPDFRFLGEEEGEEPGDSPFRWIVDPLDGTANFVHGFPMFGVSIGLEHRGRMVVGVICDPLRREMFAAVKGGGATLNGRRLRVSPVRTLAQSLLSTGFSSNFLKHEEPYLSWFKAFQRGSHGVRRIGSTVISLASVASGRLEGFYEQDLWPWDIAAGIVIVEEAGGRVTNFLGGPVVLEQGQVLASNRTIHREMVAILTKRASRR